MPYLPKTSKFRNHLEKKKEWITRVMEEYQSYLLKNKKKEFDFERGNFYQNICGINILFLRKKDCPIRYAGFENDFGKFLMTSQKIADMPFIHIMVDHFGKPFRHKYVINFMSDKWEYIAHELSHIYDMIHDPNMDYEMEVDYIKRKIEVEARFFQYKLSGVKLEDYLEIERKNKIHSRVIKKYYELYDTI
jgi:hypothetical protein